MSLTSQYQVWRAGLQAAVNQALTGEVYNAASQAIRDAVVTEAYDKYTPQNYQRRKEMGGLIDEHNIVMELDEAEMALTVQDQAPTNPDKSLYAAPFVEEGSGGNWVDIPPRPFHSVAQERLISEGIVERALAEGLQRQGFVMKFE